MDKFTRAGLAGLTILALGALPIAAQAQTDPAPAASEEPATSTSGTDAPDPAATETPQDPAASGGDASDVTPSGGPGGGTVTQDSDDADGQDSGQPSNEVGELFELPRVSEDNQIELISGLCGVQMKAMSPAACVCLAEQSLEQLSDPQRDYMIAAVVAPPVAERMLGDGRVGQPDQQEIFAFLNATSDACMTGSFVPPTEGAAPQAAPPATPAPDDAAPAEGDAPAN